MFPENSRIVKAGIKKRLKILRLAYARTFHRLTPEALLLHLQRIGIRPGDLLLVHSSYDSFAGFTGTATDVIDVLQKSIGPNGTLMMPTLPFTGTAVEYASRSPVFDVARTPSRTGLLTELFRRSSGVVRSVHPTHSVALWGHDAHLLAKDHYRATTPCGEGTPFAALLERNGKILLLGADIDSLTFYHMIEEAIEPRLPQSPFTQQVYSLKSMLENGSVVRTETRLFEPAVSRRRNLQKLVPELKRLRAWRQRRVGPLVMTLLDAKDVHAAVVAMLDRGVYCYD